MHQTRGDQGSLLAGIDADRLTIFEEQERGQRAAGLDAAGGNLLGCFENVNGREIAVFGFALVNVGQGRVGGAQVDANFHVVVCLSE